MDNERTSRLAILREALDHLYALAANGRPWLARDLLAVFQAIHALEAERSELTIDSPPIQGVD